ncbi:uncharacterized protein LOC122044482 [Zingiber officinale]|uniref:uncharacterized protein LOC122044482 n=1 Tax=Zingiber officinale TaxID=94328 RepID=UPI001C4AD532|nr:uncharacterized protein LOC122044482 [Zingiber officinale]
MSNTTQATDAFQNDEVERHSIDTQLESTSQLLVDIVNVTYEEIDDGEMSNSENELVLTEYIIMAEQQAVAPRCYKVIRVVGDTFVPDGHRVASYITSKFKERKRYTWKDGQKEQFKATWNSYCAKLYRDLMYYIRKKGTRPAYVSETIWSAWTTTWVAERWRENAENARSNRNTESGGPSTEIARHMSGSKSIVEHAMDLEHDLARQPTCMEVFLKTHKKKDGSFIDT